MATQHTSFIQPQFLISHYQILLNSIQPFRIARTVRKSAVNSMQKLRFVCVRMRARVSAGGRVNPDPGTVSLFWERQISALESGWPRLSLISPSHEEHWRAYYRVHQHKQVTSSHNSTLWYYSILIKAAGIVICCRLFGDERPCRVKQGPGVLWWGLRKLAKVRTICRIYVPTWRTFVCRLWWPLDSPTPWQTAD